MESLWSFLHVILLYHTLDLTPTEWPVTTLLLVRGVDPESNMCVAICFVGTHAHHANQTTKNVVFFKPMAISVSVFWLNLFLGASAPRWRQSRRCVALTSGPVSHMSHMLARVSWTSCRMRHMEKMRKKKVVRWWKCWEDLIHFFFESKWHESMCLYGAKNGMFW